MALVSFVVLSLVTIGVFQSANAEVPAIFILGDSTADVGTNNYLPDSGIKANFPHHGVDFPFERATGRFSNGLNTADFIAKQFGFKRSPVSFLALNGTYGIKKPKFRGINFSSAGSGLLNTTGQAPTGITNVVPMGEQVYQFSMVYNDLLSSKGPSETEKFLSESLFIISMGSNDIIGNYHSNNSIPKVEFLHDLAVEYEKHLRSLISVGARKFGILSVPTAGCCPSQRIYNNSDCLEELNDHARDFFSTMDVLMRNLSTEYKDVKYSLGNTFEIITRVIQNPPKYRFTNVKNACCGNGTTPCGREVNLCPIRHKYLFWDWFHPTQAASRLVASALYGGDSSVVIPINFSQLAEA